MRNENCSKLSTTLTYLIVFLVIAIIVTSMGVTVYAKPGDTLENKVKEIQQKEEDALEANLSSEIYYPSYISEKDEAGYKNYTGNPVESDFNKVALPDGFKPEDYISDGYTSQDNSEKYEGTFFNWEDENLKWVDFEFDVKSKAYYNIEIEYYTPKGSVQTPQRSLNIDGDLPYIEAVTVNFYRKWVDDIDMVDGIKKFKINSVGDEVRPKQKQVYEIKTIRFEDHDGKYAEPLRFALDEGVHKLRLIYQYEPVVIKSIRLVAPEETITYNEYINKHKSNGATDASDPIRIEAESVTYKSHPSLKVEASSDPMATPSFVKGSTRINVMGGASWSASNQTLVWEFDNVKAGLYKLSFRSYAKFTDGLPVTRQIKINGEVPFKEFECYEIPYSDWNCYSLNNEKDEPYLVYLNEGSNKLEITVKLGELSDIMNSLEEDAGKLSDLVKDITKITSTAPDPNFDYQLKDKVPNLVERLQVLADSFGVQVQRISDLSVKRPAAANNFILMKEQCERMIANVEVISKSYSQLTDAMSSLATWIKEFGKLPMQLDYIEFLPPEAEVEVVKSSFFQKFGAAFTSFMVSFVKDYNGVGSVDDIDDSEDKSIDVWVSRGKEWAEILKQQSDEDFYQDENITVNMNILPTGQLNASASSVLLLALASGTGPDACMGVASNLPVEYGMRGAIYPLSKFDDFTDVYDINKEDGNRFINGIMIPFYFKGEYYGIPETMDFQCLFYRKDIMSMYNLNIPDTWEDVYSKILPILNNNNMDFYYAGGYNPFLFQHNGEYFMDNDMKSAWNTPEAVTAFKQWTDLYRIYDIPVTAEFYNRFRAGQMPLGIGGIDVYTKLVSAAPEIAGKWGVAPIPGTVQEDGKINRSAGGGTTACIILNDSDKKEESWKFLKWYTSADVQVQYANDIKTVIGPEAIWASANVEAFNQLPWDAELKTVIKEYQDWYKDPPNVVGGYIVARYLENSRVAVVVDHKLYRPSLEKSVREIDSELKVKNEEFDRRAEREAANNKND